MNNTSTILLHQENQKRKRIKTNRYDFDPLDNKEERLLQQALANSRKDIRVEQIPVPDGPVYHPTVEEFKDPLKYIQK